LIAFALSLLEKSKVRRWRIQISRSATIGLDLLRRTSKPLVRRFAVDGALDLEQDIDASHGLAGNRRLSRFRQEELSAAVAPTGRFKDRSQLPLGLVELVVYIKGIGLHQAHIAGKMALRVLSSPVARVVEQGRRRIRAAKRPVIANIMRWTVPALISCERAPQGGQAMAMMTIGLDISKSWFQIHWITADGEIIRKKLARGKVLDFFSGLPTCLVGLEACGSAHHWARELMKLGHKARLMPARYVRAYVKTKKHDAADAEACWEAVQRPGKRFVPVKSTEQQGLLMLHRTRDLLIRQRTGAINALRGHLGELGIVTGKGKASARELMGIVDVDERIPQSARSALSILVDQIEEA
jgi:hypothetical protein